MAEDSESKTQGHHFQFIKTHGLEVPRIYIPHQVAQKLLIMQAIEGQFETKHKDCQG